MGEGMTPDTEGLAFESSPLQSVYARALTFIKAWELHATDGIASLSTPSVALQVPLKTIDTVGQQVGRGAALEEPPRPPPPSRARGRHSHALRFPPLATAHPLPFPDDRSPSPFP